MTKFGLHKRSQLPEALTRKAVAQLAHFSVSLIMNQKLIGSGTLVSLWPRLGVLTAQHVASLISEQESPFLGINMRGHPHQAAVRREFTSIHKPNIGDNAPDIAFVEIVDPSVNATIGSIKSFYRLDGKSFDMFQDMPLESLEWYVSGAPDDFSQHRGKIGTSTHTLMTVHGLFGAVFQKRKVDGMTDVLRLRVGTGAGFPKSYGGVSGGGVWITPFSMDPDVGSSSLQIEPCFLAGVAFYQEELEGDSRVIVAVGPSVIYGGFL